MHETRLTFLAAAAAAREAVVLPDVEHQWDEPSALPGMSIGAVAAHLARAVLTVEEYLGAHVHGDIEPISAAAYFAHGTGLSDRNSDLNVGVRERAAAAARQGARAVIEQFDAAVTRLRHVLGAEPDDRLVEVRGGLVMLLDEYLMTRILELTLHADDLHVSVGGEPPVLPGVGLTIRILVDVAELRHGEVAVLRALARRERDPGEVLRVL